MVWCGFGFWVLGPSLVYTLGSWVGGSTQTPDMSAGGAVGSQDLSPEAAGREVAGGALGRRPPVFGNGVRNKELRQDKGPESTQAIGCLEVRDVICITGRTSKRTIL